MQTHHVERGIELHDVQLLARLLILLGRHRYLASQQLHALQNVFSTGRLQLLEVVLNYLGHPSKISTPRRTQHTTVVQLSIFAERASRKFLTFIDDRIRGSSEDTTILIIVIPHHQRGYVPAHLATSIDDLIRGVEFQQFRFHDCKGTHFIRLSQLSATQNR